jgi:hypothetical protein
LTKPIARYISIGNDCKSYVGFDNMFRANVDSKNTRPGTSYLLIDTIFTPNDRRIINKFPPSLSTMLHSKIPLPFDEKQKNYHIWDWQFVQNDVLHLLPELVKMTNPITYIPEIANFGNTIRIYPNPTNGLVPVNSVNQKIKSIKLYNLRGDFIEEYFKNDFSISNLIPGIYVFNIQTDKSTFINKLVKQ